MNSVSESRSLCGGEMEAGKTKEELMSDSSTAEAIVYDQASLNRVRKHYEGLRDKASYDAFLQAAHQLLSKLGIEPYYIRMALTGKHSMLEFGSRAAFQHAEVKDGVEVGLLIDRDDTAIIPKDLIKRVHQFRGAAVDFVAIVVPTWNEIPADVLAMNEKAMAAEYKRQYGKKLVELRRGSGTDNEAMRLAVVNGVHMEELPPADNDEQTMDYFTASDIDLLARYAGVKYDKSQAEHQDAYQQLAGIYKKVAHWAYLVQKEAFPEGEFAVLKKPTNQANRFEHYQWAKIYPSKSAVRELAFTLSVESGDDFAIKIDTVGLSNGDARRQRYEAYRGQYKNSQIVKLLDRTEALELGWDGLLKESAAFIRSILPDYNMLAEQLQFTANVTNPGPKPVFELNTISYGPPGTGKTFGVFRRAIAIAEDLADSGHSKYPEQADVVEAFNNLLIKDWKSGSEQIAFVTFHQSFGYEDFVEGLKPFLRPDGSVGYAIEPGVFKRIADRAMDNWLLSRQSGQDVSFEDALEQLKEEWEADGTMKFSMKTTGKEFTVLDFTETSIPFKKASGGTGHTLSLATLRDLYYEERTLKNEGLDIYYPGLLEKLRGYNRKDGHGQGELKNYVLIIDEINRANISAVLGELITLLEPDKRRGADNQLEIMLPYSKQLFSVPPNLFVIGTMNTADRSVEALDTAIRRRFSFLECPSRPEELEELSYRMVSDVDLSKLLRVINARIEMLLDRDHHIGHSYFMNWRVADKEQKLREVFKNNIIPLLQEYFYGDPVKVGMVLGGGFLKEIKKEDKRAISFAKDFKVDDIDAKPRYEFFDTLAKFDDGQYHVDIVAFKKLAQGE